MKTGELNKRITIQKLFNQNKTYTWGFIFKLWANLELKSVRCLYSNFGMAANTTAKFTIRYTKRIDLNNSILFENKHYIITAIIPDDKKMFCEVTAAPVTPYICVAKRSTISGKDSMNRPIKTSEAYTFPGYLSEKYSKYNEDTYNAKVLGSYILVTAKEILLETGNLVYIGNDTYNIIAIHTLDDYKNEYELKIEKEG